MVSKFADRVGKHAFDGRQCQHTSKNHSDTLVEVGLVSSSLLANVCGAYRIEGVLDYRKAGLTALQLHPKVQVFLCLYVVLGSTDTQRHNIAVVSRFGGFATTYIVYSWRGTLVVSC